jgi:hypothetical protein
VAALHVYVEDWSSMDAIIAAVGGFLARNGFVEEAVLIRAGRPVLL